MMCVGVKGESRVILCALTVFSFTNTHTQAFPSAAVVGDGYNNEAVQKAVATAAAEVFKCVDVCLYGRPTDTPWRMYVATKHRPPDHLQHTGARPTWRWASAGRLRASTTRRSRPSARCTRRRRTRPCGCVGCVCLDFSSWWSSSSPFRHESTSIHPPRPHTHTL